MAKQKLIPFRNASDRVLNLPDLGIENLAPGETAHVQEGYAKPRRSHAGERFPSVLEHLAQCPGCDEYTKGKLPDGSPNHLFHCMLVPANPEDAARFSKAPDHEEARPKAEMPTVASLVAAGLPAGVAEVMVKGMLAAMEAARGEKADAKDDAAPKPPKTPRTPKDTKPNDAQQ